MIKQFLIAALFGALPLHAQVTISGATLSGATINASSAPSPFLLLERLGEQPGGTVAEQRGGYYYESHDAMRLDHRGLWFQRVAQPYAVSPR